MLITHQQAHRMIQLEIDRALNAQDAVLLSAHLRECPDCEVYRNKMREVQGLLAPLLKRQWAVQPTPLAISSLLRERGKLSTSNLLAIRTATISLVIVAMFFSVWQFMLSNPLEARPVPLAPPVPTPASQTAQAINLTLTLENCETIFYSIQSGDTLAGIADKFSITEEEIRAANHLGQEALEPATVLVIPVCAFTPTGTSHPAAFTTTLTPYLQLRTSTPGG